MESALIGACDSVQTRLVVGMAGQHDLDALRRLAHHLTSRWVAPLPGRVADRQAVRKARRDLARNKTPPGALAHTHTIADVAAEQQFGNLSGALRAVADDCQSLRDRIAGGGSQQN